MASNVRDVPAGDLTTEQVTLLVRQLTAMHAELSEVLAMMESCNDRPIIWS
ncbi:hypothetical protein [Micromonospora sp. ALFpr18c]|uniref:hypothetical protein n=1 Tax=unclassified Micromonospora TaxID=2617518 RepID=UPI001788E304|nr:hypothetical protein [Micromonospora sp. ALFpr18c]